MERITETDRLLKEIEEVGELLWKQEVGVYSKLADLITEISKAVNDYVELIWKYQLTDIDEKKIIGNLKKMVSGFENKDAILLADILNYEIYNIVTQYKQLLVIIEEEKNELV